MDYAIAIKTLRKKRKIKQKDLAKACGISVSALCSFERGRYNPSRETIAKICEALNVNMSCFILHCITPEDLKYLSPEKFESAVEKIDYLQKISYTS